MNQKTKVFMLSIGLMFCLGACKKKKTTKPIKRPSTQKSTQKTPLKKGAAKLSSQVVLASQVKWEQLNPKRGDKSPKAATLWGDRKGKVATGFLVKFVDGFRSPPHIHNVTYKGVVISGLVHNDDPKAADMWMPAGSFWTQPKGEEHVTAAKGKTNVAFIEIEKGPYLVMPSKKAFDSGERPVNVDPSNIVWLDASQLNWMAPNGTKASGNGAKVAFLWGKVEKGQLNGTFVKLPSGSAGILHTQGALLRAVTIKGRHKYTEPGKKKIKTLEPGSYFSSKGKTAHQITCEKGSDCILYVRTKGTYQFSSAKAK